MVTDSPCLDWLSSVISSTLRPSTPPAALASSKARITPLRAETPNAASLPVKAPYSPILMGPSSALAATAPSRVARIAVRQKRRNREDIVGGYKLGKGKLRRPSS